MPEREGVRRAALTAFSLLFLLLLVPKDGSFSLHELLPSVENGADFSAESYEESVLDTAKSALAKDLCDRFSLSPDGFVLEGSLSLSEDALVVDSLRIYLYKENFFADVNSLLRYVEDNYTESCEVHFIGT